MDETKKYLINVESNLDEYAKEANKAAEEVARLQTKIAGLTDEQKKDGVAVEKLRGEYKAAQSEYRTQQKLVESFQKALNSETNSRKQLSEILKLQQTQLAKLGDGYIRDVNGILKVNPLYAKLTKNVRDTKEAIIALDKAQLDGRSSVGLYSEAIKGSLGELQMMPGALGQAAGGVQRLGTAFKALIANPIVLTITAIVGALAALFKAFKSTDSGATEFAARFEQIKAIIDVVRQRLINVTDAIRNVFKGNWKEAGQDIKEAFSGIGEQMKEAASAGLKYQRALDKLDDAEKNYISRQAGMKNKIAKLEFTAQDRNKSTEERRKALEGALTLSAEQINQEKSFAKQRLEIEATYLAEKNNLRMDDVMAFIQMTDKQQESASEELKALRNNNEVKFAEIEAFYAKWIEADTRFFEENKRNVGKLSGFNEEIKKEFEDLKKYDLAFIESAAKMVNAEVDKLLKVQELRKQGLIENEAYYDNQGRLIEQSVKLSDWETAEYIKNQDLKLQSSVEVFSALSSLMGQQTEAGKAFAVAAATIDTYAAASKALNDPTPMPTITRIALMAAVIIRGLANVKQILSVKMGSATASSVPSSISASVPAQRAFATPVGSSVLTQPKLTQGQINALPAQKSLTAEDIAKAIANLPAPVVTVEDINARLQSVNKVEIRATI